MTSKKYEVRSYSIDKLMNDFAKFSNNKDDYIQKKAHKKYFDEYFSKLNVQSYIIEHEYNDKYYLEDFAYYYVRCFQHLDKTCSRFHFFQKDLTQLNFEDILCNNNTKYSAENLNDDYLGFIVIKPIPISIIGRTCLKTYPSDGKRYFPIKRNYRVNLFGINLLIQKTVAFQEQDSVVAACATTALWSAFHAIQPIFRNRIPSPVELTIEATKYIPSGVRALPNHGLSNEMIAQSIRSVGLEPQNGGVRNLFELRGEVYAYLKAHIPVVFGMELVYEDQLNSSNDSIIGRHAVTITGYKMERESVAMDTNIRIVSKAFSISKIYAHDDQVGPFARMEFDDLSKTTNTLSTSFGINNNRKIRARPTLLFIPVLGKIRIPYETVFDLTFELDALFKSFRNSNYFPINNEFVWEIFLTDVNDFKIDIRENKEKLNDRMLIDNLTNTLPHYMWRIVAYQNKEKILEFVVDATGIEYSINIPKIIFYNIDLFNYLVELYKSRDIQILINEFKYADKFFNSLK